MNRRQFFKMKGSSIGDSLCLSCVRAHIAEDDRGRVIIRCFLTDNGIPMQTRIVKCSDYDDAQSPKLYTMEEIAWTIRHTKGGGIIGFRPPEGKEGKK